MRDNSLILAGSHIGGDCRLVDSTTKERERRSRLDLSSRASPCSEDPENESAESWSRITVGRESERTQPVSPIREKHESANYRTPFQGSLHTPGRDLYLVRYQIAEKFLKWKRLRADTRDTQYILAALRRAPQAVPESLPI